MTVSEPRSFHLLQVDELDTKTAEMRSFLLKLGSLSSEQLQTLYPG